LENHKKQNDKDLYFDTGKMNKISVFFSSVMISIIFYVGFVCKFWDKEKRSSLIDYYTLRNFNRIKLKLGHQDLLVKLKTNQSV
jgi:hypothetical protein